MREAVVYKVQVSFGMQIYAHTFSLSIHLYLVVDYSLNLDDQLYRQEIQINKAPQF